jgi:Flp pilus assembly protein TadG
METAMNPYPDRKSARKRFLRDERGAVAIILTIYLPFLVGILTLAVDMSYVLWSRNMLQVTAESSALAAAWQLQQTGDKTSTILMAKQYAEKNMPAARYGATVKDADVVLRYWPANCGNISCSTIANSAGSCGANQCNAVEVTTKLAQSNNNALNLVFAQVVGFPTFNVTATAVAKTVPGSGSQNKWFATIVEDISSSFSQQLTNARAADQALLDCIYTNATAGGSKLGIALFTGVSPSTLYQSQITVDGTGNYDTLKNKISNIKQCGSSGMPPCSGSNVSAGMKSAIDSMCPQASTCPLPTSAGAGQALVIVTDGIPNCSSAIPNCSNSTLLNNAVAQANRAESEGIDVYTIYYGNSDSDANWLAGLVRGKGKAFKTPTATELKDKMKQVCESGLDLRQRLVW